MSHRIDQINKLISRNLSSILPSYLEGFKQGLVTVVDVKTAPDLSAARVWISIFDSNNQEKMLKLLNRHIYSIQGELNQMVQLKKIPKINFVIDESAATVTRLTHLIEQERKAIGDHIQEE